jgi:hypothetical protein
MKMLLSSPPATTGELLLKVGSYAIRRPHVLLVRVRIGPLNKGAYCLIAARSAVGLTEKLTRFRPVFLFQDSVDPKGKAMTEVDGRRVVRIRWGGFAEFHQVICASKQEIVLGNRSICLGR